MDKEFKRTFLSNLLITAMLIPEILLINALIMLVNNPFVWIVIGSIMFVVITYLMYLNNKRGVAHGKDRP